MENSKINLGNSLYKELNQNNKSVKLVVLVSVVVVVAVMVFAGFVYTQSLNRTYVMDAKGDLVPVSLLDKSIEREIQAKANLDLFVNYYFNLEGATMKSKQERLHWLIGEQPTQVIKDRANRGYFNDFLTYTELRQRGYILANTLRITDKAPYIAEFVVRIERQNEKNITYYNSKVAVKMEVVNKNYPFNPYGFLITQISEEIKEVTDKKFLREQEEEHIKSESQVTYE
ncbi:hypothetical protein HX049_17115 [Myroides odoratimimus]|uniref:hypothetical protein n=1 Tax=Myroides odoratimimus TaxID=76832 RepID=UPI002575E23F|nr:hypothetical protein [Myroides odoratimimus]MDM1398865.1 hypothetical protein [Myroides odoratimimus]